MSKKGRDFELLVEKLERILSGNDVEILHDVRLPDKRTSGRKRQIDVLVRVKVGTHKLLVILECRNRKYKDDVSWIDELAKKRDAVSAHKAVAISSSGFTRTAIEVARDENIDLRTIEEISISDVAHWFAAKEVVVSQPHYELIGTQIKVCGIGPKPSPTELKTIEAHLLEIKNKPHEKLLECLGEFFSLSEIWDRSVSLPSEIRQRLEDRPGTKEQIEYAVRFDPPLEIVRVSICKVCSIVFLFHASISLHSYVPYQVAKYNENDSSLGEIIRFRVQVDGKTQELDIIHSEERIDFHSSLPASWKIEM